MNLEPLKNKRIDMIYEDRRGIFCGLSIISDDNGEFFKFDDVRSAVEGLKKEIESRKIPIEKLPNKEEIISDTKEKFVSDFNQEINDIIETINKWFEDVI